MSVQEEEILESETMDRPPSKEGFISALKGEQPDFVPLFEFPCSRNFFEQVLNLRPRYYEAEDVINLSLKIGLDGAFIPYGGFKGYTARVDRKLNKQTYVDEWGTTYRDTGASWPVGAPIAYPINNRKDLSLYKSPDPTLPDRLDGIRKALELSKGCVAVMGGINGPLTVAYMLIGLDKLMLAIYEDPQLVDDLLQVGYQYYKIGCRRMLAAGVDAICIAEDMGYSTSLFMSPDSYRRHLFPLLEDLIQLIKGGGVPVFLHCDGNINPILDDLVDMGIDALHPVERKSHMDIFAIREKYGNRLCLVGNMDATTTLCEGTVDDVQAEVIKLFEQVAPIGAYILASDPDLRDEMPNENILAMFETGKRYGKYPISLADA